MQIYHPNLSPKELGTFCQDAWLWAKRELWIKRNKKAFQKNLCALFVLTTGFLFAERQRDRLFPGAVRIYKDPVYAAKIQEIHWMQGASSENRHLISRDFCSYEEAWTYANSSNQIYRIDGNGMTKGRPGGFRVTFAPENRGFL